jgi:hypothetical protein
MTIRILLSTCCALAIAAAPDSVRSQAGDEGSVPEPTALGRVAAESGSRLISSTNVRQIVSDDASAVFAAVTLEDRNSRSIRGLKLSLSSADGSDELYLDEEVLEELSREFADLDGWYDQERVCPVDSCVFGVARCRPSQTNLQAYCPSVHAKGTSERSTSIATPRQSFQFPAVRPSTIAVAVAAAIAELDAQADESRR